MSEFDADPQQGAPSQEPVIPSPEPGNDKGAQPKKKSIRSILAGTPIAGGRIGVFVVIGAIGIVFVFMLLHLAPQKHPVVATGPQQQQDKQKSQQTDALPTDKAQTQQQGLNPTDDEMTAEKIQKSTLLGPHPQGSTSGDNQMNANGVPKNNDTLGQVPAFNPPPVPGAGNGQWTPQAYNGGAANPAATETVRAISTARRDALTKSSVTYVVQPIAQVHAAGQEAGTSQEVQEAPNNLGYQPGYHLSTHLETVASTAVSAPIIAVVDFDYQRNGRTIVPSGSRLLGTLGASSSTGIVNLHFNSIRMPNGNTVSVTAVGLNHQLMPLKGIVTGRHVVQQFLLASLGGLGSAAAVFAGGNVNGQLTEADMMRTQAATSMGSNVDNQISNLQQSVSQSLVVTLPAGTRVEVMFTSEAVKPSTVNASTAAAK